MWRVLARAGDGARQHDKKVTAAARARHGEDPTPPLPAPLLALSVIPADMDCCGPVACTWDSRKRRHTAGSAGASPTLRSDPSRTGLDAVSTNVPRSQTRAYSSATRAFKTYRTELCLDVKIFLDFATVAFLFVCGKYYLTID